MWLLSILILGTAPALPASPIGWFTTLWLGSDRPQPPPLVVTPPVRLLLDSPAQTPRIYCETRHVTHVHLPLRVGETIGELIAGDDPQMWAVGGVGTQVISVKPSGLARASTVAARTTDDRLFTLEVINLRPAHDLDPLLPLSEQEALARFREAMAHHRGFRNVILMLPEAQLQRHDNRRLDHKAESLAAAEAALAEERAALDQERHSWLAACRTRMQLAQQAYAQTIDTDYRVVWRRKGWFQPARRFPVAVFNDGAFTWVRLPPREGAHHVYAKTEAGAEVVNVVLENGLYRIDRVGVILEFRDQAKGDWRFRVLPLEAGHGR